jgi:hypothetical protein
LLFTWTTPVPRSLAAARQEEAELLARGAPNQHAANLPPAQRSDASEGGNNQDREMDPDEVRDYADQGPLSDSDRDMEEDHEILATLLNHMPSCMNADDIEQLLQEILVHPPAVVPVRTLQEALAAGNLPPLNVDAANVFSLSEHISLLQIPPDSPLVAFKTGGLDQQ